MHSKLLIFILVISGNIFAAESRQNCKSIVSLYKINYPPIPQISYFVPYASDAMLAFSKLKIISINGKPVYSNLVACVSVKFTGSIADGVCCPVPLWTFQYNDGSFKNNEIITIITRGGVVMEYCMDESFALLPDLYEKFKNNKSSDCVIQ